MQVKWKNKGGCNLWPEFPSNYFENTMLREWLIWENCIESSLLFLTPGFHFMLQHAASSGFILIFCFRKENSNKEFVLSAPISSFHTSSRNVVTIHGGFSSSSRQENNLKTAAESKGKPHLYCQAKWRQPKTVKERECEVLFCLIKHKKPLAT